MHGQIKGTLEAPSDRSVWLERGLQEWITFEGVDRLRVLGGGTLDGNGMQWWINSCKLNRSAVRNACLMISRRRRCLHNINMPCVFFLFVYPPPYHQRCVTGPTVPSLTRPRPRCMYVCMCVDRQGILMSWRSSLVRRCT